MWWRGGHAGWQGGACMVLGSVHGGGMCGGVGSVHGGGKGVRGIRRDMVNERAVRLLLECILASYLFHVYRSSV